MEGGAGESGGRKGGKGESGGVWVGSPEATRGTRRSDRVGGEERGDQAGAEK